MPGRAALSAGPGGFVYACTGSGPREERWANSAMQI